MTVPSRFAISKTKAGNPTIHTLKVHETKRVAENHIRKVAISFDGYMAISEYGSKVIMLIGETGSGKTLMMNALLNYVLGVKWEDSYRYKLDPDEDETKKRGHSQSQTEWISVYTLHYQDSFRIPYSITIVDTPGFGDTTGIPKDIKTTEQMKFLFNGENDEGIDQIDAVIFVAQSDKARLTALQKYVFDCILSLFGKDIEENIFLFTTFADHNKPLVLEGMKIAKIPYKTYYKFNNSPLYAQKESASASNEDSSDGEREDYNKMFWKSGAKQFKKFFIELDNTSSQSTSLSFEVLREREALNARIKVIQQLIRSALVTLESLKQEEKMLTVSEEEVDKHSNYKYTVRKEVSTKKNLSNDAYAMTCRNCKLNCHYPCKTIFTYFCPAFSWVSGCRVCPKRCSGSAHDHKNFIYVKNIISEVQTYADVKARYDSACEKSMSHQELVDKVSEEANNTRDELNKHVDAASDILQKLGEIALKKTPTSTADYLQYLIKAEVACMELGWQDRVVQLEELLGKAKLQDDLAEGSGVEDLTLH